MVLGIHSFTNCQNLIPISSSTCGTNNNCLTIVINTQNVKEIQIIISDYFNSRMFATIQVTLYEMNAFKLLFFVVVLLMQTLPSAHQSWTFCTTSSSTSKPLFSFAGNRGLEPPILILIICSFKIAYHPILNSTNVHSLNTNLCRNPCFSGGRRLERQRRVMSPTWFQFHQPAICKIEIPIGKCK